MTPDDLDRFAFLDALTPQDKDLLVKNVQKIDLKAAQPVFQSGQDCGAFIFMLEGSVRVHMTAETGREIVLYRVESGQTCILTTACLLANEAYCADAICETDCQAFVLKAEQFHQMIGQSRAFRTRVFENYAQRLRTLMGLIEEIAFAKLDHRLAQFLLQKAEKSSLLQMTHYELSVELGSAREVISRLLKDFEAKNWIALSRGKIEILNATALKQFQMPLM